MQWRKGSFAVTLDGEFSVSGLFSGDTGVHVITFRSPKAALRLTEFSPPGDSPRRTLRLLECTEGAGDVEVYFFPFFLRAGEEPSLQIYDDSVLVTNGIETIRISCSAKLTPDARSAGALKGRIRVHKSKRSWFEVAHFSGVELRAEPMKIRQAEKDLENALNPFRLEEPASRRLKNFEPP